MVPAKHPHIPLARPFVDGRHLLGSLKKMSGMVLVLVLFVEVWFLSLVINNWTERMVDQIVFNIFIVVFAIAIKHTF